MSEAQVLVTGRHFSGFGLRAIGPVLQELVASAKDELHVMAYLLTESAAPLVDQLQSALERGIKLIVVLMGLAKHDLPVKPEVPVFARRFRDE